MALKNKWFTWGGVVAWMGLIFSFSAQPGSDSGALSGSIVESLLQMWHALFPAVSLEADTLHFIIRKGAHFTVYFILGLLVAHALSKSLKIDKKHVCITIIICCLYAVSDEIHQAFVPNRGPNAWDVLLDTTGSAVGTSMYAWVKRK